IFSLLRSGTHPTSHSFPTRRSSDLPFSVRRILPPHAQRHGPKAMKEGVELGRLRTIRRKLPSLLLNRLNEAEQVIRTFGDNQRQDRKSTRLNSSHVAISYAVFFLKK